MGFVVIGYADDIIVIIISVKHLITMKQFMQTALRTMLRWYENKGLGLNHQKAVLIPFTRKTRIDYDTTIHMGGKEILLSKDVKYLGVYLD